MHGEWDRVGVLRCRRAGDGTGDSEADGLFWRDEVVEFVVAAQYEVLRSEVRGRDVYEHGIVIIFVDLIRPGGGWKSRRNRALL